MTQRLKNRYGGPLFFPAVVFTSPGCMALTVTAVPTRRSTSSQTVGICAGFELPRLPQPGVAASTSVQILRIRSTEGLSSRVHLDDPIGRALPQSFQEQMSQETRCQVIDTNIVSKPCAVCVSRVEYSPTQSMRMSILAYSSRAFFDAQCPSDRQDKPATTASISTPHFLIAESRTSPALQDCE